MPTTELTEAEPSDGGTGACSPSSSSSGLCPSKAEARRNVQQGGVTVNDEKITDISKSFGADELKKGIIVRRGKKNYSKVILA